MILHSPSCHPMEIVGLCAYRRKAKVLKQPKPVPEPFIGKEGLVILGNVPLGVFKVETGYQVVVEHRQAKGYFG